MEGYYLHALDITIGWCVLLQSINGTVIDVVIMGRRPYIKWNITEKELDLVLNIPPMVRLLRYLIKKI